MTEKIQDYFKDSHFYQMNNEKEMVLLKSSISTAITEIINPT